VGCFDKNNKRKEKYYNINDLTDLDKAKDVYNILIIKLELYILLIKFFMTSSKI
jgi:hypothetical protein